MIYRNDIQILRGIAVTIVVLFHLGVSQLKLGFLGVDVFFVISGFLMAILCGKDSACGFYERRARRLLPAYFVTIVAVMVAAALVTLPLENKQVIQSSIFAAGFASNIGFWLQNSYFSKAAFTPLLHLWSLGVEIQFYLIAPILYMLGRRWKWFLPFFLIGSLITCFLVTNISPKTSFFMMPLRVWQFLIGWLIAWHLTDEGAPKYHMRKIPIGGLSAVVLVLALFIPLNPQATSFVNGHPGLVSVLVCIATGGILVFGFPQFIERSLLGRSLEVIGNYSYSIYLVHFPVIVLALYVPFSGTNLNPKSVGDVFLIILLIVVGSLMLHHLVEKQGRLLFSKRKTVGAVLVVLLLMVPVDYLNSSRFSPSEQKIFAAWEDRAPYRCGKIFRILNPREAFCDIADSPLDADAPTVMLVGNSHADSIKTSFARVATQAGYRTIFAVPNDPLMSRNFDHNWLLDNAQRLDVSAVVFHYSPSVSLQEILGDLPSKLAAEGIKTHLILPVPTYSRHIPSALYFDQTSGLGVPEMNISDYYLANRDNISYAQSQSGRGFSFYDTGAVLCNPDCLIVGSSGRPFYFDNGHLTITGAEFLAGLFETVLKNMSYE